MELTRWDGTGDSPEGRVLVTDPWAPRFLLYTPIRQATLWARMAAAPGTQFSVEIGDPGSAATFISWVNMQGLRPPVSGGGHADLTAHGTALPNVTIVARPEHLSAALELPAVRHGVLLASMKEFLDHGLGVPVPRGDPWPVGAVVFTGEALCEDGLAPFAAEIAQVARDAGVEVCRAP